MADFTTGGTERVPAPRVTKEGAAAGSANLAAVGRYAASLLFVAVATGAALILEAPIGDRNLTLLYVLPVIAAAFAFGWGPSLVATVAGVLAFDFFFTEPKYSLLIASPADAWAAGLLLLIATAVSAVGAESRRRERAAGEAVGRAQALQGLAQVVMERQSTPKVVSAAAAALAEIFDAPSVILMPQDGALRAVASSGPATLTSEEIEAATWVLGSGVATRAEAYPFGGSLFDFWPVSAPGNGGCVIGVGFAACGRRRPVKADDFAQTVRAYLAAALRR